jgi:hypothetical protein
MEDRTIFAAAWVHDIRNLIRRDKITTLTVNARL